MAALSEPVVPGLFLCTLISCIRILWGPLQPDSASFSSWERRDLLRSHLQTAHWLHQQRFQPSWSAPPGAKRSVCLAGAHASAGALASTSGGT